MCALYEVVIFTASTGNYADKVLDKMDPDRMTPHRLFRKHCTLVNCEFVKDLSQLGRDLKDVIIVDNSPACYSLQPCNGIPITAWTNDRKDKELEKLSSILELLYKVDDVRDYLREVVRDNELDYLEAIRLLKGEITLEDIQRNPSAYWTSPRKKVINSPERCHSQTNLNQPSEKLKDKRKEQKKIKIEHRPKQKVPQCEASRVRPSGDSYTILPMALEIAKKEEPVKPPRNPSVTSINTNAQIFKPVIRIETSKPLNNELRHVYSSLRRDMSGSRMSGSEKVLTKSSVPNQMDSKLKLRLPPRPNCKHSENREVHRRIEKLSDEANKYTIKPSINSTKAVNLSYGYKAPIQVKLNKPAACPSYGKYVKIIQPTWESYGFQRDFRSYSSSTPQPNYSRLSAGASNPLKPYGMHNVASHQENSNSYCLK
jgi:hypothetical protein